MLPWSRWESTGWKDRNPGVQRSVVWGDVYEFRSVLNRWETHLKKKPEASTPFVAEMLGVSRLRVFPSAPQLMQDRFPVYQSTASSGRQVFGGYEPRVEPTLGFPVD